MSYIGTAPTIGNFQVCDAISTVNGQASYTMLVGGVNATPQSANHMLVSLNGILQKPGSSFTVSGSTITFASNLVTGDVIDFIQILGNVLDLGVPSDSTVSLAKLTATGTKSSSTFLRGDNTFDTPPLGGITNAQSFQLTSAVTLSGNPAFITTNIGTNAVNTYADKGTIVSQSSGVFSFSATGYYLVTFHATLDVETTPDTFSVEIQTTNDNSSYNIASVIYLEKPSNSNDRSGSMLNALVNVDNTSNVKVKFSLGSANGISSCIVSGASTDPRTTFNFIRLGDSV
jgi:hypothetical protein